MFDEEKLAWVNRHYLKMALPSRLAELAVPYFLTAGVDMALTLAAEIAGDQVAQAIQLSIEYDPHPPFDAGSPEKAPAEIVEALRERARFT